MPRYDCICNREFRMKPKASSTSIQEMKQIKYSSLNQHTGSSLTSSKTILSSPDRKIMNRAIKNITEQDLQQASAHINHPIGDFKAVMEKLNDNTHLLPHSPKNIRKAYKLLTPL